jgi:transposase
VTRAPKAPGGRGLLRMRLVSYYVGLDVHRQSVSYCVKRPEGTIVREGKVLAQRQALTEWARSFGDEPWCGGLEATICSHWIYHLLQPYAAEFKMAHPARLKAISSVKRKTDCLDARTLADLLRCDLFPECYVMPPAHEQLREQLRYRSLIVRTSVLFKNKTAGLLIENGVPYETSKLHGKKYFAALLRDAEGMSEQLRRLLSFNRSQLETLARIDRAIIAILLEEPLLCERVKQLRTVDGVGEITALTWALETGDPGRFRNVKHAISYCGLCAAQRESAGVQKRGPISRQRNILLQTTLIEAAHLAPRFNQTLRAVHQAELAKGHHNRATLEVARRLVRYLLAIDRQYFQQHGSPVAA